MHGTRAIRARRAGLHDRQSLAQSRGVSSGRREAIRQFLTRKWAKELDYRLIKELWAFRDNRIAVRFAYEWHDDSGNWFRSYGNENWEFDAEGLCGGGSPASTTCRSPLPIANIIGRWKAPRRSPWTLGPWPVTPDVACSRRLQAHVPPHNLQMKQLQRLLIQQGHKCFFCGKPIPLGEACVEHLDALSNGGEKTDQNCVACCRAIILPHSGNLSVKDKFRAILSHHEPLALSS